MRSFVSRLGLLAISGIALSTPVSARIDRVRSLTCSGGGENFSLTFDHSGLRAALSSGGEVSLYSYEQGDAFQTWRLIDDKGRQRFVIREGDVLNGDFGWYFESSSLDQDGKVHMKPGGQCSVVAKEPTETAP